MMRLVGSSPSRNAGSATEKMMDLRWQGGTIVISRLIFPSVTSSAAYVMASLLQFGRNTSPCDTVSKAFMTNVEKFSANIKSKNLQRPAGLSLARRDFVSPILKVLRARAGDLWPFIVACPSFDEGTVVRESAHPMRSMQF